MSALLLLSLFLFVSMANFPIFQLDEIFMSDPSLYTYSVYRNRDLDIKFNAKNNERKR